MLRSPIYNVSPIYGKALDEAAIVEMLLYKAVINLQSSVSQNKSFTYTEDVYLDILYSHAHTGILQ